MEYIIGNSGAEEVQYFDSLEEFMDSFDMATTSAGICYLRILRNTEELPDDMKVEEFLNLLFEDMDSSERLLTFSVTSLEERHMEWIEAARKYPGSGCTTIKRGKGKNKYSCYFVTIPHPQQFSKD